MLNDTEIQEICQLLCVQRGIDWKEHTRIPCPDKRAGCCVAHFGPAWKQFEYEVRNRLELDDALKVFENISKSRGGTYVR